MGNAQIPAEVSKAQLVRDFNTLVTDAEALLKATAGQSGEAVAAVRSRVTESLAAARDKLGEAERAALAKARAAASATDHYVHEKPWQAVGVAVGLGLLVGLLIGRR
jgi:ElaB/YqjD/DUF883 family membrane-anchored ribosome-binding protein